MSTKMIADSKQGAKAPASCPVNMNGSGKSGAPDARNSFINWTRTIFVVILSLILVALAAWTVVLYSIKLVALQDRVSTLETQCQLNEQNVQKYIDDKLDKLLEEVRIIIKCYK